MSRRYWPFFSIMKYHQKWDCWQMLLELTTQDSVYPFKEVWYENTFHAKESAVLLFKSPLIIRWVCKVGLALSLATILTKTVFQVFDESIQDPGSAKCIWLWLAALSMGWYSSRNTVIWYYRSSLPREVTENLMPKLFSGIQTWICEWIISNIFVQNILPKCVKILWLQSQNWESRIIYPPNSTYLCPSTVHIHCFPIRVAGHIPKSETFVVFRLLNMDGKLTVFLLPLVFLIHSSGSPVVATTACSCPVVAVHIGFSFPLHKNIGESDERTWGETKGS